MHTIDNPGQLSELVQPISDKPYETNFYMKPEKIMWYIERRKFLYDNVSNGLILYLDKGEFYIVYIYTDLSGELIVPCTDKPLSTQVVYLERKGVPATIKSVLRNSGFEEYILYKLMIAKTQDVKIKDRTLPEGYHIDFITEEQIPQVMSMLYSTFDIYTSELPDVDEMKYIVDNKFAVCIMSPKGEVCGYRQWKVQGDTCFQEHLVVLPEERRKGFGIIMDNEALRRPNVRFHRCWIASDNQGVTSLHFSQGYSFSDKRLATFIRNRSHLKTDQR